MFSFSYQIAKLAGIPIRVHITLLIFLPLIVGNLAKAMGVGSVVWGLAAAVGLFASVALHELGHSVVAMKKGCRVRDILLLPIGGVAQLDALPTRPRDEFQIAVAGPAVSLLLSVSFWFAARMAYAFHALHPAIVLSTLAGINLMLVLFNLLPSFPMDGGRIFRAWITPRLGRLGATRIAAKIGRFMAIVFGIFGVVNLNLFLVAIAVFIHQAAGAEYRQVHQQEADRHSRRHPLFVAEEEERVLDEGEVTVSPPPYYRKRSSSFFVRPTHIQHDLFDDLFERWR